MVTQGYFKIWRELFTKPIWLQSSAEHKSILITLLAMANYTETKWEWNGKQFEAQPGQFVTSANSIINACGLVTRQNVRSALERFKKLKFLTMESTKTGMLITIENWALYQGNGVEPTKKPTKNQPTANQQPTNIPTTNKEVKELKELKNKEVITELEKMIEDFIQFRIEIKEPMTDDAKKKMLVKLNRMASDDDTKAKILEQSIVNGWQGIFELKEEKKHGVIRADFKKQRTDNQYAEVRSLF